MGEAVKVLFSSFIYSVKKMAEFVFGSAWDKAIVNIAWKVSLNSLHSIFCSHSD